jgi:hypothetical protein
MIIPDSLKFTVKFVYPRCVKTSRERSHNYW